jgi:hypothetical protein
LKLRVVDEIAALFRPDGEEKMLKTAGVLLYRRLVAFLWWFGGFKRPKMGDQMRERERERITGERRESLRFCYGVNVSMVHRCS